MIGSQFFWGDRNLYVQSPCRWNYFVNATCAVIGCVGVTGVYRVGVYLSGAIAYKSLGGEDGVYPVVGDVSKAEGF